MKNTEFLNISNVLLEEYFERLQDTGIIKSCIVTGANGKDYRKKIRNNKKGQVRKPITTRSEYIEILDRRVINGKIHRDERDDFIKRLSDMTNREKKETFAEMGVQWVKEEKTKLKNAVYKLSDGFTEKNSIENDNIYFISYKDNNDSNNKLKNSSFVIIDEDMLIKILDATDSQTNKSIWKSVTWGMIDAGYLRNWIRRDREFFDEIVMPKYLIQQKIYRQNPLKIPTSEEEQDMRYNMRYKEIITVGYGFDYRLEQLELFTRSDRERYVNGGMAVSKGLKSINTKEELIAFLIEINKETYGYKSKKDFIDKIKIR